MNTASIMHRRNFLVLSTAAGAAGFAMLVSGGISQAETKKSLPAAFNSKTASPPITAADGQLIRPFQVSFPDAALTDLQRRVAATKWPGRELVADATQGVQLETMQKLARYWQTDYDWRKFEKKLNALPQFTTEIDGLEVHFIHVRSKHANSMPLIITHGWPACSVLSRRDGKD